ncbi:MAG: PilZ domain-containing protein [Hydrogenothermaceae bacterium]|nr:PilZ domain-containing protein [Hydrogenothermaceae bacterium]
MDNKENVMKGYQIAMDKLSQIDLSAILLLITLIILLIVAVLLTNYFSKRFKEKYKYIEFEKFSKEKELSEKQYKILWDYSLKLGRDPFLAIEFKSPFEKVIDLYIKENPNFDEELIKDMRKKLGFDYVPYFVPITTTKDIDLFQGGILRVGENRIIRVALYDKDERFMYWVVTDEITMLPADPGDIVKINFVRKGDAAYIIEIPIEEVINDNGKIIIKAPHTFELIRVQRREYPRVETDLDCIVGKEIEEKTVWLEGKIVDISPSGARVCIPPEKRSVLNLKIGDRVYIQFDILNKSILQKSEIVNIYEKQKTLCYGVRFIDIKESIQRDIFDYVKRQQQAFAKLHSKQS